MSRTFQLVDPEGLFADAACLSVPMCGWGAELLRRRKADEPASAEREEAAADVLARPHLALVAGWRKENVQRLRLHSWGGP